MSTKSNQGKSHIPEENFRKDIYRQYIRQRMEDLYIKIPNDLPPPSSSTPNTPIPSALSSPDAIKLAQEDNTTRRRSNTADYSRPTSTISSIHKTAAPSKLSQEILQTRGTWQAYLDVASKRIYWVDQDTGQVSWYVSAPDPKSLPTGSYVDAASHYIPPTGDVAATPSSEHKIQTTESSSLRNIVVSQRSDTEDSVLSVSSIISTADSVLSEMSTSEPPLISSIPQRKQRSPSKLRKESTITTSPTTPTTPTTPTSPITSTSTPFSTQNTTATSTSSASVPRPLSIAQQPNSTQLKNALIAGLEMNKHRSRGAAKRRFISFSNNLDRIMWSKSRRAYLQGVVLGKILIQDMVEVRVGFDRGLFRTNFNKPEQNQCCFLLQANHRTLNLETDTTRECEEWVTALRYVISAHRLKIESQRNQEGTDRKVGSSRASEEGRSESGSSGSGGGGLMRSMTFWMRGNKDKDKGK